MMASKCIRVELAMLREDLRCVAYERFEAGEKSKCSAYLDAMDRVEATRFNAECSCPDDETCEARHEVAFGW